MHLSAWFRLNRENPNAWQLLYIDIPKHYVFIDQEKKWSVRHRVGNPIISQMYSVSHRYPERFYLRLILLHGPGASSDDDLRIVNGTVASSFREACIQRHLFLDDTEYHYTLTEASMFQIPNSCEARSPTSAHTVNLQMHWDCGMITKRT